MLAGTSLVSGEAKAVVFATGMHTEFGKIAHLTQTGREAVSPLQRADRASKPLDRRFSRWRLGVIFFAIGRIAWSCHSGKTSFSPSASSSRWCPKGCCPRVTLALVMATQRMAKRHVLIRHLPSVETLGSTTVICTDKTGTLTQNRMTVKRIWLGAGVECAPNPGR